MQIFEKILHFTKNCSKAPGCKNRAEKNSNIIILVTIMIILLKLYHGIMGTLA